MEASLEFPPPWAYSYVERVHAPYQLPIHLLHTSYMIIIVHRFRYFHHRDPRLLPSPPRPPNPTIAHLPQSKFCANRASIEQASGASSNPNVRHNPHRYPRNTHWHHHWYFHRSHCFRCCCRRRRRHERKSRNGPCRDYPRIERVHSRIVVRSGPGSLFG